MNEQEKLDKMRSTRESIRTLQDEIHVRLVAVMRYKKQIEDLNK